MGFDWEQLTGTSGAAIGDRYDELVATTLEQDAQLEHDARNAAPSSTAPMEYFEADRNTTATEQSPTATTSRDSSNLLEDPPF